MLFRSITSKNTTAKLLARNLITSNSLAIILILVIISLLHTESNNIQDPTPPNHHHPKYSHHPYLTHVHAQFITTQARHQLSSLLGTPWIPHDSSFIPSQRRANSIFNTPYHPHPHPYSYDLNLSLATLPARNFEA